MPPCKGTIAVLTGLFLDSEIVAVADTVCNSAAGLAAATGAAGFNAGDGESLANCAFAWDAPIVSATIESVFIIIFFMMLFLN